MTAQTLAFHAVQFQPVEKAGQPWLKATDLAKALGYSREDVVSQLFRRNQDEFTPGMTETVKLTGPGYQAHQIDVPGNLPIETRIFSLRGCHLLAMFARTPIAKEFRRWVLDVLDKVSQPAPPGTLAYDPVRNDKAIRTAINVRAHELAQRRVPAFKEALEAQARRLLESGERNVAYRLGDFTPGVALETIGGSASPQFTPPQTLIGDTVLDQTVLNLRRTLAVASVAAGGAVKHTVSAGPDGVDTGGRGRFVVTVVDGEGVNVHPIALRSVVVRADDLASLKALIEEEIPSDLLPAILQGIGARLLKCNAAVRR